MEDASLRSSDRRHALSGLVAAGMLSALPGTVRAQTPGPRSMVRLRTEGQASPPAAIADLAWLQGHWTGPMPEGPVEHVTLAPAFGHLPGFVRAVNPQGVIFYEICVFVQNGDSLTVRVKHFSPLLAGWEAREAYIDRPLVARDGSTFYFDGITYMRTGQGSYTVYFLNRSGTVERDTLVIPFRRMG